MDMREQRRLRLQELVEQYDGIEKFIRARSKPDAEKHINSSHISQILTGKRNLGEKAARNLEKLAGLPEFYFDKQENSLSNNENKESEEKFWTENKHHKISEYKGEYNALGIDVNKIDLDLLEMIQIVTKIEKKDRPQARKIIRTFVEKEPDGKGSKEENN